ncbi:MAG: MarR family transcriptional regulator [Halieaceae bacterium]
MPRAPQHPLVLSQYLPYQLVNLAKRVSDACNREYGEPYGISIAEWRILARLGQQQELHSQGLGGITFMDKSRVSRALAQLQSKGYLDRRTDPQDNRASFLTLTRKGKTLYQKIVPLALTWEEGFLDVLNAREQQDLRRLLSKLEGRLSELDGYSHTTGETHHGN